ncbi:hypothetical protein SAMN02745135_02038 [Caloranaerobacter azorensis DSM 13643]|uniref:Cyclic GMP-AMP synthase n=1 Tax=Caloranaerobacter azorensis DSM 13643 TaxID=1121264 RepID=A0A1M5VPL3_9FIRM|nr:nucleotidyltransferase [Caloranaerobacter azorensis]SHH76924.1 hypothetical protein SAMN02745135_02038 [Caloranaerobacter azorensis DSM 13643]
MASIQKQFEKFHDEIKLKRFDENATLREKRDIITNRIKEGLKKKFQNGEEGVPNVEFIDQGSYAVDLGINPDDGNYDIDEGAIFDLYIEDYEDPTEIKKWIRDIMDGHTVIPPIIKNPCVTITYSQNNEPIYHVDIPVYAKSKYDSKLYLAWGKEHSNDDNKYWEPADPIGLNEYINNRFTGDDKKQFKRIVRYMKKWKDICFKSSGNARPPSIGITIAAVEMFMPYTEYNQLSGKLEYVDLIALKNFVWKLKNSFISEWDSDREEYLYTIYLRLPVTPYKNIFSKMSKLQMTDFYYKLGDLYDALQKAEEDCDPHTACKLLANYFGNKFPIPEPKESRYQVNRSNAPSSSSA